MQFVVQKLYVSALTRKGQDQDNDKKRDEGENPYAHIQAMNLLKGIVNPF
jgi:hypothetical protein